MQLAGEQTLCALSITSIAKVQQFDTLVFEIFCIALEFIIDFRVQIIFSRFVCHRFVQFTGDQWFGQWFFAMRPHQSRHLLPFCQHWPNLACEKKKEREQKLQRPIEKSIVKSKFKLNVDQKKTKEEIAMWKSYVVTDVVRMVHIFTVGSSTYSTSSLAHFPNQINIHSIRATPFESEY